MKEFVNPDQKAPSYGNTKGISLPQLCTRMEAQVIEIRRTFLNMLSGGNLKISDATSRSHIDKVLSSELWKLAVCVIYHYRSHTMTDQVELEVFVAVHKAVQFLEKQAGGPQGVLILGSRGVRDVATRDEIAGWMKH